MTGTPAPSGAYAHVGHQVPDGETLPTALLPLLRNGLERGDPVVLACPPATAAALQEALGAGDDVVVVDPGPLGGRAPDALAGYGSLIAQQLPADGHRMQLVTGTTPRTGTALVAWLQTEALLNHVLADRTVDQFCLLHPAHVDPCWGLASATHPFMLTGEGVVPNRDSRPPVEVLQELGDAPGPDPIERTPPVVALADVVDMRGLRRELARALAGGPLTVDDAEDLVLAIDEIASNAAEHGMPPVDVRLWSSPEKVLCAVTDHGPCFDEPLAGYGPAHGSDLSRGGMGLWLARRAVDRMTTAEADGGGCTVRLLVEPHLRAR